MILKPCLASLVVAVVISLNAFCPLSHAGVNPGTTTLIRGSSDSFDEGGTGTGLAATPEEMQAAEQKREQEAADAAEGNLRILDRGTLRGIFKAIADRTEVPAFISLRNNRALGKIIGPYQPETVGFQANMIAYVRWSGSSRPELGEIYATYHPRIVMQNRADYTDFRVRLNKGEAKNSLDDFTLAGYLYEAGGEVEIVDISRGVVKVRLLRTFGQVSIGDFLMPAMPRLSAVKPVQSPLRLTATVISGYPSERLGAGQGSFLHINRGRRDGVKLGTMFRQMEAVPLMDGPPIRQSTELGEAITVYVSDAFSTLQILKQFSIIRVGSILETIRPGMDRSAQFNLLGRGQTDGVTPESGAERYLSELDKIEKDSDILSLSPEERERLERLHRQEIKRRDAGVPFPNAGESAALPAPSVDESGSPALPEAPNLEEARKRRDEARKKRLKQRQQELRRRDEEKLNQLFER